MISSGIFPDTIIELPSIGDIKIAACFFLEVLGVLLSDATELTLISASSSSLTSSLFDAFFLFLSPFLF